MKLIDKDALVAEIEKRIKFQQTCIKTEYRVTGKAEEEIILEYKQLLSFLDTLEEKEVDLEKFTEKINTFQARYKHSEITSIKGAMAFMARMFYQYPNVAREWYESLPKATMD